MLTIIVSIVRRVVLYDVPPGISDCCLERVMGTDIDGGRGFTVPPRDRAESCYIVVSYRHFATRQGCGVLVPRKRRSGSPMCGLRICQDRTWPVRV